MLENINNVKNDRKRISGPLSITLNMGTGTAIIGDTLYCFIFYIPIFPIARYSLDYYGGDYYIFYSRLKLHWWQRFWIIMLLFGISCLIISIIVTNIAYKDKLQKFDIIKNGYFREYFQINALDHSKYSVLKPKILPINMQTIRVDRLYDDLPPEIKPDSANEINSLIQIWRYDRVIDQYEDKSDALQQYIVFKIIDLSTKSIVYIDTIYGGEPPMTKRGHEDAHGSSPDDDVIYLLKHFFK